VDQLGDGANAEFGDEIGAVELDGTLVDAERGGDLFVEQALDDEAEDFAFAVGEKIEGTAQGIKVCAAAWLLLVGQTCRSHRGRVKRKSFQADGHSIEPLVVIRERQAHGPWLASLVGPIFSNRLPHNG
jgi:hypothetical protein